MTVSALLATGAAVAACGGGSGGIPKDAVASVDGTAIPRASFTHWITIAAKSDSGATVPDPPTYARCIATKKAAETASKAKPSTPAALKAACVKSYTQYRSAALEQLVAAEWIKGEASSRHLSVTPADVNKTFQQQKTQAYPKDADYQAFLKQSGETQADILETVKVTLLANKLSAQVTKGKDAVTDADIAAYYAKNKSTYAKPESRDLSVVVNTSKAKATAAAAALKAGGSWKSVAKKYSSDKASAAKAGEVGAVTEAALPPDLAKPVYAAAKGKVIGPITTGGSSYVFTVNSITAASQETLAQATAAIKQTLQTQKQQTVLAAFTKDYQKRWRAKTTCADEIKISACANGPEPTPTPTAPAVDPAAAAAAAAAGQDPSAAGQDPAAAGQDPAAAPPGTDGTG
jgi:foldase protein PrsA